MRPIGSAALHAPERMHVRVRALCAGAIPLTVERNEHRVPVPPHHFLHSKLGVLGPEGWERILHQQPATAAKSLQCKRNHQPHPLVCMGVCLKQRRCRGKCVEALDRVTFAVHGSVPVSGDVAPFSKVQLGLRLLPHC
jgi:hypothetical protein